MIFRWAAFPNPFTIRSLSLLQEKLWRHLSSPNCKALEPPESTKKGGIDLIRAIYENDDEMKLFPKTIRAIPRALLRLISDAVGREVSRNYFFVSTEKMLRRKAQCAHRDGVFSLSLMDSFLFRIFYTFRKCNNKRRWENQSTASFTCLRPHGKIKIDLECLRKQSSRWKLFNDGLCLWWVLCLLRPNRVRPILDSRSCLPSANRIKHFFTLRRPHKKTRIQSVESRFLC